MEREREIEGYIYIEREVERWIKRMIQCAIPSLKREAITRERERMTRIKLNPQYSGYKSSPVLSYIRWYMGSE